LTRAIDRLAGYPDPDCVELTGTLARRWGVPAGQIVVGNGSSEILFALARACRFDRAVIPVPTYGDYAAAVEAAGRPVELVATEDDFRLDWQRLAAVLRPWDLVFLGQPNNPTGRLLDSDEIRQAAQRHPQTTWVVDEAFADFVEGYRSLARRLPANVIVVRSLTKFYAVPGLRLGLAVAGVETAGRIRRQLTPWSVGTLAQAAAGPLLADDDYARRTVALVRHERERLSEQLSAIAGLHVYPAAANFLLVRIDRGDLSAAELAERLLARGIAIRTFDAAEHLDGRFFRVAVRTGEENEQLCAAIAAECGACPLSLRERARVRAAACGAKPQAAAECGGEGNPLLSQELEGGNIHPIPLTLTLSRRERGPRGAPAIMIQGTGSSAGKSVLAAALCRILLQDGVRVAPFKAQNMSLNSFVTREGGEMGRAQVVQAQACRVEPDVRMNPVLLKPDSDTGCQVIVRGRPVGNMRVGQYVSYKPQAFAAACQCYDSLAAEFDAVVLEGAGSPGEVNLKHHDIVNMRMAEYARAPVLVVGDIDRGGLFAAFVGTMEVLSAWERKLVAGWIVNRFRGDPELLTPALDYTLERTGRPVLGVVPYLAALDLPQEDSVEFKSQGLASPSGSWAGGDGGSQHWPAADAAPPEPPPSQRAAAVEIALVDLPHVSNFTDFDALRVESDVRMRVVRSPAELDGPDAVLIPGSKNTLGDLEYLRRSGLAERIVELARRGRTEIVGICGGFQMLGREVCDPLGLESAAVAASGLGLLEVHTVLAAEKTLLRTRATHVPSGLEVAGYEIHHGQTTVAGAVPLLAAADGRLLGAASPQGRVWGTYLHGIFDADGFRRWFLDRLRVGRGLPPLGCCGARYDIEGTLERLADVVRRSVKMDEIYRLLRL
jgi:histidinol-phosphate aminotransferase